MATGRRRHTANAACAQSRVEEIATSPRDVGRFANYVYGSYFAAILWGLFVGGCLFLFVAPKVITAAFGSLIGTSLSETGTASGLITKTTEAITKLAINIGKLRPTPPPDGTEPTADPVIFNAILMLCCAPAFFTKHEQ